MFKKNNFLECETEDSKCYNNKSFQDNTETDIDFNDNDTFRNISEDSFDNSSEFDLSDVMTINQNRYKLNHKEKELIRKEFKTGIPIQRLRDIIDNYKDEFKDEFIELIQSYHSEMINNSKHHLTLNLSQIDALIHGFENTVYLDRSISNESINKLQILLNREISVIEDWREPRRSRISGKRIQITSEGIKLIKNQMKSGIPIQRLLDIINEYDLKNRFIEYIKEKYLKSLNSRENSVIFNLTKMDKFITNWGNILYRNAVISENDFNKLQLLVGEEKPIPHEIVYGRSNLPTVKLIKNGTHAEFIGVFIVRGSIRTDRDDLYISYNSNDHPQYISHLKKLITKVSGRSPSTMGTRDRFYISGPDFIQYLSSLGLSNEKRKIPLWIKKPSSWIQLNLDEWEESYAPLVIACLKGMINGAGSISVASNTDRIVIYLSKSDKTILKSFKEMCNSLNIKTSEIKRQIKEDGRILYYIYIISKEQVKKFLIDIVKPLKWDYIKDNIEKILNDRGTSTELVLEMTPEFNNLRRKLFQHQKQQYSFLYNPKRIKNIKNKTLRVCYNNYIKNISLGLFPSDQFEVKTNIRPSSLKFVGEHVKDENGATFHREIIKTDFLKEHLINNNPHIEIYHYKTLSDGFYKNLLDIVRQVYDEFLNENLGRPWHEPILKKILITLDNALASEVPVWRELRNGKYYIGHIDLNLIDNDTFYVADLKDDEIDIIKSLAQITSYAINQKKLIFNKSNIIDVIEFKCIVFTKDELWVLSPEDLKHDIINFIKYANSIRDENLKSLPFSKGLQRTDLLDDFKKAVFFLQKFINEEEINDLDNNKL